MQSQQCVSLCHVCISAYQSTFFNVFSCFEIFRDISRFFKIFRNIWRYFEIFWDISRFFEIFYFFTKHVFQIKHVESQNHMFSYTDLRSLRSMVQKDFYDWAWCPGWRRAQLMMAGLKVKNLMIQFSRQSKQIGTECRESTPRPNQLPGSFCWGSWKQPISETTKVWLIQIQFLLRQSNHPFHHHKSPSLSFSSFSVESSLIIILCVLDS